MTQPTTPPTHYLSVHDLAARWGEHTNTVYARVRVPEWLDAVRTIQLGRQLRFLERDVDAYEDAHRLTADTMAAALADDPAAGATGNLEPAERLGNRESPQAPASEFAPRRPPVRAKAAA